MTSGSDDQAVDTGLDLAEGERLLKWAKELIVEKRDYPMGIITSAGADFLGPTPSQLVALVAALKAANEREQRLQKKLGDVNEARFGELLSLMQNVGTYQEGATFLSGTEEFDKAVRAVVQLRADLARVEAERDDAVRGRLHLSHLVDEVSANSQRLQARIAELERSLRGVYETHGRVDDGPCWCYDCERARANLAPAQTPTAS